jgi:Protein of unknown function (DUF4254)
MIISEIFGIFEKAINDFHIKNDLEAEFSNPYQSETLDFILYHKCYIDTIQWHCEDEVRNPQIVAEQVRYYKNKIDKLNQERTNCVEKIDDIIWESFKSITPNNDARLVTESPAWAIDRLSILALKLYHMEIEVNRKDISEVTKSNYLAKFSILQSQKTDLMTALDNLLEEIKQGKSIYKLYRQVKMYNDADLNPVLRNQK